MIDDVHENRAAIEVCVARVELRESADEIVSENLVRRSLGAAIDRGNPPGLVINPDNRTIALSQRVTGGQTPVAARNS